MPEIVVHGLELAALFVEGIGFAILLFTALKFVLRYVTFEIGRIRGFDCARYLRDIRLELGGHIILAIDFMVISDIIHTTLAQTRDNLITLAVFVLIRSALALFIGLDMRDVREERTEQGH